MGIRAAGDKTLGAKGKGNLFFGGGLSWPRDGSLRGPVLAWGRGSPFVGTPIQLR